MATDWQRLFGKSAKVASYIYHNHPEVSTKIIQSDNPGRVLDEFFSKNEMEVIGGLKDTVEDLNEEIHDKSMIIDKLQELDEHKNFWDNKHPKKHIRYRRPIYTGKDNWELYSVSVTDFIMPNDFDILERIEANNLFVNDRLKINEAVPRIYAEAKQNYSYKYDSKSLGMSEFWKFPPETLCARHGDCEDWGNLIASFLIAAGVPSWRVRVTYGVINAGGYGHSTVYVLDDDMQTWRHLNSTEPDPIHKNLSDYPKFGGGDALGIDPDRVWGSFNDKFAWHILENKTSKTQYKKSKIEDKLVIY